MKNEKFTKLYSKIIKSDLGASEKIVLCYLLGWRESQGSDKIQMSNKYLGEETGNSPKNIIRIKDKLQKLGLVSYEQKVFKFGTETVYTIHMDNIKSFCGMGGEKEAQNQEIIENECNNTQLQPNTSFYPTSDGKNQECDDEVNVTTSNPIEIDDNEEEMNVIESTDFIVGNDDEDYFRELLRENVDLLGCMSYDGLTKHKVAYDFLANSAITRQRVDNILMEERKRRMESKWAI